MSHTPNDAPHDVGNDVGDGSSVALAEELAREQRHIDAAYRRLDDMRAAAQRVAEGWSDVRQGGTHQARLERDVAVDVTRRRLATLDIGDSPLVFGRLDLESERPAAAEAAGAEANGGGADDGSLGPFYVGRLAVMDQEQTPLVVDWRAPVAEPFYRATAVEPMGVVRRRHFHSRGRELLGLDDEVFDGVEAAAAGHTIVGEAALLAALGRSRTGRMHDIVATIQAEQDEAIRADIAGVLLVAGGPGTGKTAVALHRAAYLLYTHRRRLGSDGVLLVGPTTMFLRYIDQVLPALGEEDVVLATPASLKPQLTVTRIEDPDTAVLKGDARMARVIAGALADRERPLPRDIEIELEGHRLRLRRSDTASVVERGHRRRGSHNERRPYVTRLLVDQLRRQYRRALTRDSRPAVSDSAVHDEWGDRAAAALLARGEAPSDEWEAELAGRLRRNRAVRAVLDRIWPVLTGAELVHDLFSFPELIHSASGGILTEAEEQLLYRPRSANVREVPWTDADVALVDEADDRLGPVEAARARRRRSGVHRTEVEAAGRVVNELGLGGYLTPSQIAERYGASIGNGDDPTSSEPRTFGHILVDEAQDLSAMEWRMLARRSPSRSMTIVGDFGQSSRPGALGDWDAVVAALEPRQPPRRVVLSTNYRTPAEIMEVANRVLAAAAPGVDPARPVRATHRPPDFRSVDGADLLDAVNAATERAREETGTLAVVAPADMHAALVERLGSSLARADSADAIDAPIAVLTAVDAKGLEFDHVVVVEPVRLVSGDRRGLRLLYVALTRATRSLTVVHAEPLPEALTVSPRGNQS